MIPESKLFQIRNAINCHPELLGARIGFHGNLGSSVLDYGNPNSRNYDIIIIIEEVEKDFGLKLPPEVNDHIVSEPRKILNRTKAGAELTGALISCGFTVAAGFAVVGLMAGTVPTAGASAVIVVATWTGLVTQALQCANGVYRTVEAYQNPNENSLERWDSQEWYSRTMLAIDGVGIVTNVGGIVRSSSAIRRMLTLRGSFPTEEALEAMGNPQKVAAYRDAIKKISKNPRLAAEFDNLLKQLGPRVANRLRRDSEVIIRRSATSVSRIISAKTSKEILKEIKDIVINGAGIAASGMPPEIVGSASGSVRWAGEKINNWAGEKINNIVVNIITNR